MNYLQRILKHTWILFSFIVLVIFIIIFFLFSGKKTPEQTINTPLTPTAIPTYVQSQLPTTPLTTVSSSFNSNQGIIPGVSTTENLKNTFGSPADIKIQNDLTFFIYKDPSGITTDTIYASGSKISYSTHQFLTNNTLYTDFLSQNKKTPSGLFYDNNSLQSNFLWYIFPDDGIAFLADNKSGNTIREIYFIPTTLADFEKNIAPFFSLRKGTPPQEGE